MDGLGWKTPRLSDSMGRKGIAVRTKWQSGRADGNAVPRWLATLCRGTEGGTASIGNERCAAGKSNPYLSRKIYLFCCRQLSSFPKRTDYRCFWGSPFL